MSYARICLNSQFQLKKSILTTKPASVIRLGIGSVLIDASISGASAEADTQFSIFDSSTLKKQLLIFTLYPR